MSACYCSRLRLVAFAASAQVNVVQLSSSAAEFAVPMPANVLGFTPGDDRKLASWSQVLDYFQQFDRASDRVMFETLGQTSMGKPFVMATISAPENLAKLERVQTDPGTTRRSA